MRAAESVGGGDRSTRPSSGRSSRIDEDQRIAGFRERSEFFAGFFWKDQHGAVGRTVRKARELRDRAVAEMQRRRKHDLQVLLVQRIERASEDSREVFGFDERQRYADQTCTDSWEVPARCGWS